MLVRSTTERLFTLLKASSEGTPGLWTRQSSSTRSWRKRTAIAAVRGHQLGLSARALNDLDTPLHLGPNFADAYHNRGVVRDAQGLFREVEEDFDQVINRKPRNGAAFLGREIVRLNLGDHADWCDDWRQGISLGSKEVSPRSAPYWQHTANRGDVVS